MSTRNLSWPRMLVGVVLGAMFCEVLLFICAGAAGELLGGDDPAGTLAEVMIFLGTPIALIVGAVLGGWALGFRDRRLFATIGGALLGLVVTYVIAIPVSIVYGGALDRMGVMCVLGYGLPIAIVYGAIRGRRRYERWQQSRPPA